MHIFGRMHCMEGCYSSKQRRWRISVPHANGSSQAVLIDHPEEGTVENLLTELLKHLHIPLAALPVFCLARKPFPATTDSTEKNDERWLERVYGLPFFLPLPKPCPLFLRIDTDLLPSGGDERDKLLGCRGCDVLTTQVLSEAVLADLSAQAPIELLFQGLRYLESRGEASEMEAIRKRWFLRISRRSHSTLVTVLRQIDGINRTFVQDVEDFYRRTQGISDDPRPFLANVETFTPVDSPLRLFSEIQNAARDFDPMSLLCQLDSLEWNSTRSRLTVSFFRNFSEDLETVTMKRRVSARKFSLVIRYLAVKNPAVKCSIKDKSGAISRIFLRGLRCRDETYGVNGAGDKETLETIVEDSLPLLEPKTTVMETGYLSTLQRIEEETRGHGIELTVKQEPKPFVDRLLSVSCDNPVSNYGIYTEMRIGILPTEPYEDEDQQTTDNRRTVKFAVRRLKNCSMMTDTRPADNLRTLARSAHWALDAYSARWPLLAVEGLRMDDDLCLFSRWMPLGSLHDLLVRIKGSDVSFSVRHFLQAAGQLCAALLFLERLGIADVGLHPRNVLVEELQRGRIAVRLCDAGTRSLQQQPEWQDFRSKQFRGALSDDLKDFHITMRLTTLYRPGRDLWDDDNDHRVLDIPEHLWRSRNNLSICHVLLWARELLKCDEKDVKEELDRALSAKIAIQDVPSVMKMDSDLESWRLGRDMKELGKGNFGKVYLTTYRDGDEEFKVAVKSLQDTPHKDDFEKEVNIMKRLRHPHIVQFINCYPKSHRIVMTYCNSGKLLEYVKKEMSDDELQKKGRQFCIEICEGMDYLHNEGVIHRDLALRNILLHSEEADKLTVKISDFGLSRILDEEVYELKNNGKLPAYWLPPSDMGGDRLIKKVDVWSFGVCMWEIFTRGSNPITFYQTHTKGQSVKLWSLLNDLIFKQHIYLPGDGIDPFMYRVMRDHCWLEQAEQRSSFAELLEIFTKEASPCSEP